MSISQQADIIIIKIVKRHPQGDAVIFHLEGRFIFVQFLFCFLFLLFVLPNTAGLHALFYLKCYMKMGGKGGEEAGNRLCGDI